MLQTAMLLPDGPTFSAYCAGLVSVIVAVTTLVKTVQNSRPREVRDLRTALRASERRERRHAANLDHARAGVLTEQAEKARLVNMLADTVIPAQHPGTRTGTQEVLARLDTGAACRVTTTPAAPLQALPVMPPLVTSGPQQQVRA